jgi:SagB-type dehydrogenase family enzyme
MKKTLLVVAMSFIAMSTYAQDITLPNPVKTGGKPLMEAAAERRSERTYVKKQMPTQQLSNLLWIANGFNREDKRTVPTGQNRQEMELYVMFDDGVYFYDAKQHLLKQVAKGNFKEALGQPHISNDAALTIIMVADQDKSSIESARMSTAYISQNIYLFAASEGLGTVARRSFVDKDLSRILRLTNKQTILLVQPVGFLK